MKIMTRICREFMNALINPGPAETMREYTEHVKECPVCHELTDTLSGRSHEFPPVQPTDACMEMQCDKECDDKYFYAAKEGIAAVFTPEQQKHLSDCLFCINWYSYYRSELAKNPDYQLPVPPEGLRERILRRTKEEHDKQQQ